MYHKLGVQRGTKSIKSKWEKLKRDVKQRLALEKKEMYMTGGGTAKQFKPMKYYKEIVELLGVSAIGLDSGFDSDNISKFNLKIEFILIVHFVI